MLAFAACMLESKRSTVGHGVALGHQRHGPAPVLVAVLPAAAVDPDDDRPWAAGLPRQVQVELLPLVAAGDVFQVSQPIPREPSFPPAAPARATPPSTPRCWQISCGQRQGGNLPPPCPFIVITDHRDYKGGRPYVPLRGNPLSRHRGGVPHPRMACTSSGTFDHRH